MTWGIPGPTPDRRARPDLPGDGRHPRPPELPTVLVADLAGAERAVADGPAARVPRACTVFGHQREAASSEAAAEIAEPVTPTGDRLGRTSRRSPPDLPNLCSSDVSSSGSLEAHFGGDSPTLLGGPGNATSWTAGPADR